MQNTEIRSLQPEDADEVLRFMPEVGGETDNLTFGKEGLPYTISEEQDYLRSVAEDPHSVMLGAFCGGELVGTASLTGLSGRMSHRAELGICVLKAYWNQGIGSALLSSLNSFAAGNGIELISLEVRSDNAAAIHLYEKYGFVKTGYFPAFFKIGDTYHDFDLMVLDLRNRQ